MNFNSNKILKSTVLSICITVLFFKAQSQQNIFAKMYEVPQAGFVQNFEIVRTYDNGYLAGNTRCLLKTDSVGNKQMMLYNASLLGTSFQSIDYTRDSGYICAGAQKLIKLDSAANINWIKEFSIGFSVSTIRETPDYGFIMGGYRQFLSTSHSVLIKTDSSGNVQWSYAYTTNIANSILSIELTPDSGYLLCGGGISIFDPNRGDICVIKINSSGNPQWAKHYAKPNNTFNIKHITATSDGNYVICGGVYGMFLLKIDGAGNQLWMKEYFPQAPSVAQWVEETADNGLIVGGYPIVFGGLIMKTDSAGNFQWINAFSGSPFGGCIKPTPDGGYVFATRAIGANGHAIAIIKTDSLGLTGSCTYFTPTVTVTNVADTVISIPVTDSVLNVTTTPVTITISNVGIVTDICPVGINEAESLSEITIYPNPATTHITLQYHLTQNATLQIHDITGRRVQQTTLAKTSTTATIDVRALPKGMYFYSVQGANGEVKAGKFVKQ